ncbi:hypothetical protein [Aliarcobacter butzleri]|jgi:hypothetical protein|uniref:Lipoprotein n=4 Tax=Aliarcobacter butzleri TaxID=28197 RepID=A0AAP4PM18_9BACT|nr:hypothetical protein [Aliarcobacter butzleri]MCP3649975.1 hypothetical protein [Arcobacter sp. DNRA7]AGR78291.1 conserved hypothetical lipoprotein [Aliarcobacter butzleri 7h1h]EFU69813.1 conserved hypothetical protein [Aliarcobacter butzleri JV22]KLD97485.1 hypothetical protein AF74_05675 [Aliarcobacter butzleri L349]KLE01728.1 hypothetical protein AA20_02480 [Aliarcobacter butzleri L348]
MKYILVSLLSVFLFTACSGKKYFEPEDTSSNIELNEKSIPATIKSFNKIGATLEDNKVITKNGISQNELPEGFEFLNLTEDGRIIATNYIDKILIGNQERKVSEVVVAASLRNEKLALIYSNNSMELIDINTNKTLFKEYLPISLANDTRITNPFFMGNLILFPSLNGRVIIVSSVNNEAVRNISVDPDSQFNNIIYIGVIESNQTLIVASPNRVVSISPRDVISKEYDLRDIIVNNNDIYIATIDGQIIKLNATLDQVAKKKYKYAKIHALAFSDSLYAVESQGFLINIDENFDKDVIYDFSFDNEERMIAIGNKIYFGSDYITLP